MEFTVQSLKNIATIKSAVVTSLNPELKQEILCARGSEYGANKSRYRDFRKRLWNEIIEKKGREILRRQELPKDLEDKVVNFLPAIGLKILIWAEYHEDTLGFARNYSLHFLRFSHFDKHGIIDNFKAAEDMLKDGNLSYEQKYKLACIYCFEDHIGPLYNKITIRQKTLFTPRIRKWVMKPGIVMYWTCRQASKYYEYFKNEPLHVEMLRQATGCGSKAAVKYWWSMINSNFQENAIFVEEVHKAVSAGCNQLIFRNSRHNAKESWVPTQHYLDDMSCFIFLLMIDLVHQEVLQINLLRDFDRDFEIYTHKSILELFLCWPYQDYFMQVAAILWEFLPETSYVTLISKICDKIEPQKDNGEDKCYDYRSLLKKFWSKSPLRLKRIVLKNKKYAFENYHGRTSRSGQNILFKLLSLKKFTLEDKEIIMLILDCATDTEKANLMFAACWRNTFIEVMKEEKFEVFDRFLSVCFQSQLKASEFRQELKLEQDAWSICTHFMKYKKLNAIKSFMERISLSKQEVTKLKRYIIYSSEGKQQCLKLLSSKGYEALEIFLECFLPSKGKVTEFQRELTVEYSLRDVPYKGEETLLRICEDLISSHSLCVVKDRYSSVCTKSIFRGGQWKKINQFLPLVLTENKIVQFKKTLCNYYGERILNKLIEAKQWTQTEKFFSWLGLSEKEISSLKKNTLLSLSGTWNMFHYLVFSESEDETDKWNEIDRLLRWHLSDAKTVDEFRCKFLRIHEKYDESSLNIFNSLVDKYLDDLQRKVFILERKGYHPSYLRPREAPTVLNVCEGVKREASSEISAPKKKARLLGKEKQLTKLVGKKQPGKLVGKKQAGKLVGKKQAGKLVGKKQADKLVGKKQAGKLVGKKQTAKLVITKRHRS